MHEVAVRANALAPAYVLLRLEERIQDKFSASAEYEKPLESPALAG